jgi:hypothetical protein
MREVSQRGRGGREGVGNPIREKQRKEIKIGKDERRKKLFCTPSLMRHVAVAM